MGHGKTNLRVRLIALCLEKMQEKSGLRVLRVTGGRVGHTLDQAGPLVPPWHHAVSPVFALRDDYLSSLPWEDGILGPDH